MSPPFELEFVLVSNDYATVHTVSDGVKQYGGKFVLFPDANAGRDYLNRRKTDGLFLDMEVPGALGLIDAVRRGTANNKVVIFACGKNSKEYTNTLNAGANFVLRKPLVADSILLHITIAKELLLRERRRFFRHAVNLPVLLKEGELEQRARMTMLSEGGMAVHTVKPLSGAAIIEFRFELPLGVAIQGKGQVAWSNTEGMAGIEVNHFEAKGKEYVESWLTAQEEIGGNKAKAE
jgi:CheY-like chemotaxis protein